MLHCSQDWCFCHLNMHIWAHLGPSSEILQNERVKWWIVDANPCEEAQKKEQQQHLQWSQKLKRFSFVVWMNGCTDDDDNDDDDDDDVIKM